MEDQLKIFVATLEGSLLAFGFNLKEGLLTPDFTAKDHAGRIRALHASKDGVLVTTGDDENLRVYNYKRHKSLSHIFGVCGVCPKITSSSKFIVSCHENGSVCVIGKTDYAIYHILKCFKSSCIDIDLHHSSKLLIALSKTGRFALWDLMTCQLIFHKKVKLPLLGVKFFDDERVLLIGRDFLLVFNLRSQMVVQEVKSEGETVITDVQVVHSGEHKFVVVAAENGHVYFYPEINFVSEGSDEAIFAKIKAYAGRVKRLKIEGKYLTTVSTEGDITIWNVSDILKQGNEIQGQVFIENFEALFDYSIHARPVLLDVVLLSSEAEKVAEKIQKIDDKALKKSHLRNSVTKKLQKLRKISHGVRSN